MASTGAMMPSSPCLSQTWSRAGDASHEHEWMVVQRWEKKNACLSVEHADILVALLHQLVELVHRLR